MARLLIDRGFTLVRPLAGGLQAWVDAGYDVESEPLIAIGTTGPYAPAAPSTRSGGASDAER